WLAPRGRFAFAVWGPPAENAWLTNVRDVVAEFVTIPTPAPDTPGPFRYGAIDMLLRILEKAGLGDIEVQEWRGSLGIGGALSPEEAAPFALKAFSSFGELLANAGPTAFDDARRALTARLSRFEVNGAVRMDACVRFVTGAAR